MGGVCGTAQRSGLQSESVLFRRPKFDFLSLSGGEFASSQVSTPAFF